MSRHILHAAALLIFLLSTAGCSPGRHLPEGQLFYRGAEARFVGKLPAHSKKVKYELLEMARPEPNGRLLGLYPRIGIYNAFAQKEKGIGKWLREKLGEAPVAYSQPLVERSRLRMEKHLRDNGYLQASVGYDTLVHKRKATVIYEARPGARYTIGAVDWPQDSSPLAGFLEAQQPASSLNTGVAYQLSLLEQERERLAGAAREEGFFRLSSDNFYFYLDTTLAQHQAGLYLRVAPPQDGGPFRRHYIGQATLYPTYLLDEKQEDRKMDTARLDGFRFLQSIEFVRPSILKQAVLQREGELYVHSLQQKSVNRLLGLGPYKFVNLKYQLRERNDSLFLDRQFFLTPGLAQDFSAELEASSLESNSLGSALNVNYTHRNFFGGAENFSIGLSTGLLTQLGRGLGFINSYNLSLEGRLSFPHFLVPFGLFRAERAWQARSTASLGTAFERRASQYTLQSFRGQFGYQWQPGQLQRHELNPAQLTWVNTRNTSAAFDARIAANPRLRASFGNYFIAGAAYQYTYSEQKPQKQEDYFYFQGRAEAAGNLSFALASLIKPKPAGAYELFGVPFAQFFRLEADARYHHFFKQGSWIVRANVGVALPYGNSGAIPYIRQFFAGGANSIRAFQFRELGPGSNTDGFASGQEVSDQTGDIKLEMNAEYRFPLFSYLRGAAFVDAGNIWLARQQESELQELGGFFKWDSFYREIALGAGLGLRLDITYFVLRLDVAFPLRRPFPNEGFRWVAGDFDPGSRRWRRDNLLANLALGYPF